MKITNEHLAPPVHKSGADKPGKPVSSEPEAASSLATSTSAVQSRMKTLFTRVGIRPGMAMHDAKSRRHALDRRSEILAVNRINNLQAILTVALGVSVPEPETESLDPDWFFTFCTMAENIYSPAMQELWGKIFAAEVSRPGSFSLRSLETLKALTQRDAKIFSRAAALASRRSGDTVPRILVGYHQRRGLRSLLSRPHPEQLNLSAYGLSYPDLLALNDMKLIYTNEIESGELLPGSAIYWRCGNENFQLTPRKTGVALVYYKFTAVGAELFKLINRNEHSHYLSAIKQLLTPVFEIK